MRSHFENTAEGPGKVVFAVLGTVGQRVQLIEAEGVPNLGKLQLENLLQVPSGEKGDQPKGLSR